MCRGHPARRPCRSLSALPRRRLLSARRSPSRPDPRYAPVYALLDDGLTDPQEIARQTGLGQGEVDLILSLRARRAL